MTAANLGVEVKTHTHTRACANVQMERGERVRDRADGSTVTETQV